MESDARLDLEAAIVRWRAASALDADTLAELEAHLRDAFAAAIARSLAPNRAFRAALAQLGDPAQLSAEFSKLHKHRSPNNMKIASLAQSPRLRRYAGALALVLALAIPLRVFALAPYRAAGASVAPEIPNGSHLLVWRIAPNFAPGDIAAYRHGQLAYLGRVVSVSPTGLTVSRANEPAQSISRDVVIGRVVLATR